MSSQEHSLIADLDRSTDSHWDTTDQTALLLQAIPSILVGLDSHTRIKWWNKGSEKLFSLSPEIVTDRLLLECEIAWDADQLCAGLTECRKTGEVVRIDEIRLTRPNGEKRILGITINPIKASTGNLEGYLVLGADITQRKQRECEREQMLNLFMDPDHSLEELTAKVQKVQPGRDEAERLLASISTILIGIDRGGRITRWNVMAEEIFGMPQDKVIGGSFNIACLPWDGEMIQESIEYCRKMHKPARPFDTRYTGRNGRNGYLRVSINPILGATDTPSGFLLLGRDVTKTKILETKLQQSHKLELIGELAAGIAHEINTPTQYVGDNTRFVQDAFGDLSRMLQQYTAFVEAYKRGTVTQDLVEEIEAAAREIELEYQIKEIPRAIEQSLEGIERVTSIVRAMKEFSHPGIGEKMAVDLNKAIESTITVARNEWKYVAEIVIDLDPSLPLVPCLPSEFKQVILNILINATHALADVVKEDTQDLGTISVSTRRDCDWVEIRIADTGSGIPEAARDKVFDPFFTTKDVGKGTGQGLAIAHDVIVQKHNGTITFETEEGVGTVFILRLPTKNESEQ